MISNSYLSVNLAGLLRILTPRRDTTDMLAIGCRDRRYWEWWCSCGCVVSWVGIRENLERTTRERALLCGSHPRRCVFVFVISSAGLHVVWMLWMLWMLCTYGEVGRQVGKLQANAN